MRNMKASFFKRMGAFVIDYFIVLVIASLITMGFNTNKNNDLNSQMNQLISDYQNEKIFNCGTCLLYSGICPLPRG